MILRALFAIGLVLLTACQSQLTLMPTPEILKDPRFNLFAANPEPLTSNTIATLYATTRVPAREGSSSKYTAGTAEEIRFGYATTRIGEENLNLFELIDQSTTGERKEQYAWTMLDAPVLGSVPRPEGAEDPATLPTGLREFMEALNEYIDSNPVKELTIYVHGANNTFYWSVAQGAQFQYFTGDNAMVLTFSWPSPGSIFRYGADKRRSDASAGDLAYLVELLAKHSTASRINLLAYSAGGRVVGKALKQLGERHREKSELKLGQVYLTQSDQSLTEFANSLPVFIHLLEGLTVTAAADDPVLGMARMTDFQTRLGAVGEGNEAKVSDEVRDQVLEMMNSNKLVLIDVQNVPAAKYKFSHGAWYDSSWVSTDVMASLLGSLSPTERGLEPSMINGARTWAFPPDYVERFTDELLKRENRKLEIPPIP